MLQEEVGNAKKADLRGKEMKMSVSAESARGEETESEEGGGGKQKEMRARKCLSLYKFQHGKQHEG